MTNKYGCSSIVTKLVNVTDPRLAGNVAVTPLLACENSSVTLSYQPAENQSTPTTFKWFYEEPTGTPISTNPTISVTEPGRYFVHVGNGIGCEKFDNPPGIVSLIPIPTSPVISGKILLCEGETVKLSVPNDSSAYYQWYIDGNLMSAWNGLSMIEDIPYNVETIYGVTTRVPASPGVYCTSEMATVTVYSKLAPEMPEVNVEILSCLPYKVRATITNYDSSVHYLWSNGAIGATAVFNHDGPLGIVAGMGNCTTEWEGDLPTDLNKLVWIFPEGCYDVCTKRKGSINTLIGPYGVFDSWEWLMDGAMTQNGSVSEITDYEQIPSGHSYQMTIEDGGCTVTLGDANIEALECAPCAIRLNSSTVTPSQTEECEWVVQLQFQNPSSSSVVINLRDADGNGYFDSNILNIPPGNSTQTVVFYPLNGFAGGSVIVTMYGSNRGAPCESDGQIEIPGCEAGFVIPRSTATSNLNQSYTIIAPNPTTGVTQLFYNFADVKLTSVDVVDILGRILISLPLTDNKGNVALDISSYAAGQYIVMLKSGNEIVDRKKLILSKH